jgi:NADPH-dependent curcumin reductase CurA
VGAVRLGRPTLREAVNRRLTLQGFVVSEHHDLLPEFRSRMSKWVAIGQVRWEEHIVEGMANAPQALFALFRGDNLGKTLIKVGSEPG